ncbi:hypothetical protein [Vibrio phage BUCT194]|uniref:Uncharacterized protein n=1 Tax=Vibrio phage BUCT194 TaxID=2859072 RepID=A0AAE8XF70_9CAUD|nr:hypothetical protein PP741_gp022 [Vibrio phage BUCT194]UAW01203.1 hypothetical protein [Vibrio phage BUCT194]
MKKFDFVEYNPFRKQVSFFVKLNGCDVLVSTVNKDLGDCTHLPSNINTLSRMTGITLQDIQNGYIIH